MVTQRPMSLFQPFLLILGTLDQPLSFNLVVDNHVIPCGSNSVKAFSVLFASFYVFRVKFPKLLEPFYSFLADIAFEITSGQPAPTNLSFKASLDNLSVVESVDQHKGASSDPELNSLACGSDTGLFILPA